MRGQTADRQEIGAKDTGKLHELVTDVPSPAKRSAPVRIRLECEHGPSGCDFKTKLYPERDRSSAEKELGKHAVEKHSFLRRVRLVTERREELV